MSVISVFDLIILAILAALTLRGVWKGMVSQIISIASFFVCWVVATRFGGLIAPTIPLEAPWNQVAAMAVIFVITLVAIRFAYAMLEKLIKHWHLEKLNTLFGGLLGFTKGLLLCMIITFFAVMVSETSRDVVFNSKSGFHLVRLITQVGVFVPKDSYEFVHVQFAQFNEKVDNAAPGKTPETVLVQSSETAQQMREQLEPTRVNSLFTALSKWWKGSKEDTTAETAETTETVAAAPPPVQKIEPSPLPAVTYTPPPPMQPVNTYAPPPQPVAAQSANPQDFFQRRVDPVAAMEQLAPLMPSAPDTFDPPPFSSPSSLMTLAPLTDSLPGAGLSILPESEPQLMPAKITVQHVGSDLLLRNSAQLAKPDASAKVFQSQ
jgi:membrane protein required for colicin V production